jgi:hypothetical protein
LHSRCYFFSLAKKVYESDIPTKYQTTEWISPA